MEHPYQLAIRPLESTPSDQIRLRDYLDNRYISPREAALLIKEAPRTFERHLYSLIYSKPFLASQIDAIELALDNGPHCFIRPRLSFEGRDLDKVRKGRNFRVLTWPDLPLLEKHPHLDPSKRHWLTFEKRKSGSMKAWGSNRLVDVKPWNRVPFTINSLVTSHI